MQVIYPVRAAAQHAVHEHHRVQLFRALLQGCARDPGQALPLLGELMLQARPPAAGQCRCNSSAEPAARRAMRATRAAGWGLPRRTSWWTRCGSTWRSTRRPCCTAPRSQAAAAGVRSGPAPPPARPLRPQLHPCRAQALCACWQPRARQGGQAVQGLADQLQQRQGQPTLVFEGSSPGAQAFRSLELAWAAGPG